MNFSEYFYVKSSQGSLPLDNGDNVRLTHGADMYPNSSDKLRLWAEPFKENLWALFRVTFIFSDADSFTGATLLGARTWAME